MRADSQLRLSRSGRALGLALGVLLVLGACGGGGDDDDSASDDRASSSTTESGGGSTTTAAEQPDYVSYIAQARGPRVEVFDQPDAAEPSNVLEEFNGGDGVIGIHGTNDPSSIGQDVSHGCIRVTNDVITQMAGYLPLGTPVEIVA